MDKLFFDTNVLLDVLEKRSPWFPESAECLARVRRHKAKGGITAISLSDISYLQRKAPAESVYTSFQTLRQFLDIAAVDAKAVDDALARKLNDLEDGFQFAAAQQWGATHFLTRNTQDFPQYDSLTVQTPSEYLTEAAS